MSEETKILPAKEWILGSRAPAYAYLIPLLAAAARRLGYALAVRGSMQRDLDLVAIPWVEDAAPVEELVASLAKEIGFTEEGFASAGPPKPHGRRAWSLTMDSGFYVDLSVMPRGTR